MNLRISVTGKIWNYKLPVLKNLNGRSPLHYIYKFNIRRGLKKLNNKKEKAFFLDIYQRFSRSEKCKILNLVDGTPDEEQFRHWNEYADQWQE